MTMSIKDFWTLLRKTFYEWHKDYPMLLAGAISFFTIFSIVPFFILIIALAGQIIGEQQAQAEIIKQLSLQWSPQTADAVAVLLGSARHSGAGIASILSGVLVLYLASYVFIQIQDALNVIWGVSRRKRVVFKHIVVGRLFALAMVMGVGIFLFASFLLDATLQSLSSSVGAFFPEINRIHLWKSLFFLISLGLFTVFFALIYRYVPQTNVKWRDVWLGAAVTSLLFGVGRYVLTLYFKLSNVATIYGATGSILILLLWIYFSAHFFLYGAQLSWVFANEFGSRSSKHRALEKKQE